MRRTAPSTLLATATALALLGAPADAWAGKPAKPAKPVDAKLECKVVFGPGAEGAVRYEANGKSKLFQVAVKVRAEEVGDAELSAVPLYAEGDVLPVSIGTAPGYAVGSITLAADDDAEEAEAGELSGRLRLSAPGRGKAAIPADFPTPAAGALVTIDGQSCALKARKGK